MPPASVQLPSCTTRCASRTTETFLTQKESIDGSVETTINKAGPAGMMPMYVVAAMIVMEREAVEEEKEVYRLPVDGGGACCSSRIISIALKASSRCHDVGYGDDVAWGQLSGMPFCATICCSGGSPLGNYP
jgi:hypothetical protein